MVVARQQKEVLSWQLPLIVSSDSGKIDFNRTARTLCPTNIVNIMNKIYDDILPNYREGPIISISTAAQKNISYSLIVYNNVTLFINSSTEYTDIVSPSEPR